MAYIRVENLKYRYPNTTKLALDGLDFEIEKGSFVGIIGENGAGKSTLCQAFNGLVPGFFKGAYGGKVLIEDIEVAKTTVSKLCQKVGLVFQNPFNQLSGAKETVFEEIAFGLQNFGVPKEEMISRVDEVMELLDIAAYRSVHCNNSFPQKCCLPCCHRGNQDPLFPPCPPEAAGTFYLVVLQIFYVSVQKFLSSCETPVFKACYRKLPTLILHHVRFLS